MRRSVVSRFRPWSLGPVRQAIGLLARWKHRFDADPKVLFRARIDPPLRQWPVQYVKFHFYFPVSEKCLTEIGRTNLPRP
jgi:hypothetical protein